MGVKSPLPRLEHIASAIAHIEVAVRGKSFDDFSSDPLLRAAVERWTEIISEASRRIPTEMKEAHPTIPWSDIAGIGNVLRHNYEDIVPQIIWKVAIARLAPLKAAIGSMIADWRSNNRTP